MVQELHTFKCLKFSDYKLEVLHSMEIRRSDGEAEVAVFSAKRWDRRIS